MTRIATLAASLALAAGVAGAQPAAEPEVRAVIARQATAWNGADMASYFAIFDPAATIRQQARTGDKLTPYGTATIPEARTQSRRFLAKSKSTEIVEVRKVQLVADGTARASSFVVQAIRTGDIARTTCADRFQVFDRKGGKLVVTQQVDTFYRCPRR